MNLIAAIKSRLPRRILPSPASPPETGLYSFDRVSGENRSHLHLRVNTDGSGILLVNASRIFQLNPSAAAMAFWLLSGVPRTQIIPRLCNAFGVSLEDAVRDFDAFEQQFTGILQPDGLCPICDLDLETTLPFSSKPSAPYRMDLAVTYRCNNACTHCYNARSRSFPEMDTAQWKKVLERLWRIGIPHIVFTGGEPTLRPDLPDLIACAVQKGQIVGLNTNGRRLQDPAYVQSLVDAGLDHVQITLESHDPAIHDLMVAAPGAWQETVAGVRNALATRLFVMTNTTMLASNAPQMEQTLTFLGELGLPTIGLNALIYAGRGRTVGTGLREEELPPLLTLARRITARYHQRLIWYTPTQYCHFDPVQMELGVKGCTAAYYNMCIEPDGSVIPCQSYYHSLGNILAEPWDNIWNHDLSRSLRERTALPEACQSCSLLPECGGGCPLARLSALESTQHL